MKLVCLKCNCERELSKEEMVEASILISVRKLSYTDILLYFNMLDKNKCEGVNHRYSFDKEFLSNVLSIAEKIKGFKDDVNKLYDKRKEIEKQLEQLDAEIYSMKTVTSNEEDKILDLTEMEWYNWID